MYHGLVNFERFQCHFHVSTVLTIWLIVLFLKLLPFLTSLCTTLSHIFPCLPFGTSTILIFLPLSSYFSLFLGGPWKASFDPSYIITAYSYPIILLQSSYLLMSPPQLPYRDAALPSSICKDYIINSHIDCQCDCDIVNQFSMYFRDKSGGGEVTPPPSADPLWNIGGVMLLLTTL